MASVCMPYTQDTYEIRGLHIREVHVRIHARVRTSAHDQSLQRRVGPDDNEPAAAKETEHRRICARNFSCNPINGARHRPPLRHAADPSPELVQLPRVLWSTSTITAAVYTAGPLFVHWLHVPLRKCAVWIPTDKRARERCILWMVIRYTGCTGIAECNFRVEIS